MRIRLYVRGKIGRGPEADLVNRYCKRIPWSVEIIERPDTGGPPLPAADNHVRTILLDERGSDVT
ncbi:MAG: 23S rRNA (pseudouridine(1915)-N(3))-methyltransferase RlmH, partial [Sphingopyxis sp.]